RRATPTTAIAAILFNTLLLANRYGRFYPRAAPGLLPADVTYAPLPGRRDGRAFTEEADERFPGVRAAHPFAAIAQHRHAVPAAGEEAVHRHAIGRLRPQRLPLDEDASRDDPAAGRQRGVPHVTEAARNLEHRSLGPQPLALEQPEYLRARERHGHER